MTRNSYVEFCLGTYDALLVDCASQYPDLTKEFRRDFSRLSSAIEKHGLHFTMVVMPAFRKHFDQCLAKRRLTLSHLTHFGAGEKGGVIPRLFRGLFRRVFDRTGALKHQPDITAIKLLRQLLGAVRKLRMEASTRDKTAAVVEFYQIDSAVRPGSLNWLSDWDFGAERADKFSFTELVDSSSDLPLLGESTGPAVERGLLEKVQQVADLITATLGVYDPTMGRFKHGPGAVSGQAFGDYKYNFRSWPDRLERVFPFADFALANYAQMEDTPLCTEKAKGFLSETPAKLCCVPKSLDTPRLIACESPSLQWCQQSVRDFLYTRVQETFVRSFVDFRRQDKNGSLALEASLSGRHATIDLSSASDRISCWHVERLFRRSPSLLDALQASRSVYIEQKICRISPRFHWLRKYSTMGNATTFPVQSLLFLTLALASTLHVRKQKVNFKSIRSLGEREVRVFGDDIIVPIDGSSVLVELIHALGLRVNPKKTFMEGNFRESCGVDAYAGHDVTSVNILDVPRSASPGSVVSSVDTHNNLCEHGFIATAAFLRKTAARIARVKVRFVEHGSGLFGWSSLFGTDGPALKTRFNRHLQVTEVQCHALRVREHRLPAREPAGLLQYFTEAPKQVTSNVSTLGYLSRRPKVGLVLRWVPAR